MYALKDVFFILHFCDAFMHTAKVASEGVVVCTVTVLMATVVAFQADFDVRWCKGPVVERLFKPLTAKIVSMGGQILSGRRVLHVQTLGDSTGARYAFTQQQFSMKKRQIDNKKTRKLRLSAQVPIAVGHAAQDDISQGFAALFALCITDLFQCALAIGTANNKARIETKDNHGSREWIALSFF